MPRTKPTVDSPIHLIGTLTWIYDDGGSDPTRVDKALIRGEYEIVVECTWEGIVYTILLKSSDGVQFDADFPCTADGQTFRVQASATLWSNRNGYLLFGRWIQEGDEMYWMAELRASR